MSAHLARAWELYRLDAYADCIAEAGKHMGENGDDAQALAVIAMAQIEMGELRKAFKTAKNAVALDPADVTALDALARAHYALGRAEKALHVLEGASNSHPDDAYLLRRRAMLLIETGRGEQARPLIDRALLIDPDEPEARETLAYSLFEEGRFDKAEEMARDALKHDPDSSFAHEVLGWALLGRRQSIEALGVLREALRLDPHSEWARLGVLEAMSARNVVYAALLAPSLWAERRGGWKRAAALWLYVGVPTVFAFTAGHIPSLMFIVVPLVAFVAVTLVAHWVFPPLMRVMLRFDREGRRFLTRGDVIRMDCWFMIGFGLVLGLVLLGRTHALFTAWCVLWAFLPLIAHARRWPPGPSRIKARFVATLLATLVVAGAAFAPFSIAAAVGLYFAGWIAFCFWAVLAPVWADRENLA